MLATIGRSQLHRGLSDLGFQVSQAGSESDEQTEAAFASALGQNMLPVLVTPSRSAVLPALRGLQAGESSIGLVWLDARRRM